VIEFLHAHRRNVTHDTQVVAADPAL
jgi:hypothetical protein